MSRNFNNNLSDYLDLGDITNARFAFATTYSVLCFFRVENTVTVERCIHPSKYGDDPSNNQQYRWRTASGAAPVALELHNKNTLRHTTSAFVELDTWYLMAFIVETPDPNSAVIRTLVYDMDLVEKYNATFDPGSDESVLTAPVQIGRADLDGSGSDPMDGDLAHACYVLKQITPQEVKSFLANSHRQVMTWRSEGQTVPFYVPQIGKSPEPDWSGSGNNGIVNGSPTIGGNPPVGSYPMIGGFRGIEIAAPAGGGGVDTERKRRSVAAAGRRWRGPSIVPDGSISQGDRYAIARNYWRETEVAGQPGKGVGEAVGALRGHVVRGGLAKAIADAVASGKATAIRISPASGIPEASASGQPTAVRLSRSSGRGEARSSAFGTIVHQGRASAAAEAAGSLPGGAVLRAGRASGIGSTSSSGQPTGIRAGRASAVGDTQGKGVQTPQVPSEGRAVGEAAASSFGVAIRAGRGPGAPEASAAAFGVPIRAGGVSGSGESRTAARGTVVRAGRASAAGEARGAAFGVAVTPRPAKGIGEASASAQSTGIRAGRSAGVAEVSASGRGTVIREGRAAGRGEARASAIPAVVATSRASAVAASRSSAIPTIVHRGRVGAAGEGVGSAQPTAIRAGRASGIGETLGRGEQAPTLPGRGTGIGVSRASARSTVVRAGRASAIGETKASPLHDRFAQVKTIGESRASAKGTVIRAGRASAVGASKTEAFLVRAFWIYDLIRGETRYEMRSTYLPREVDTHVRIERRSRKTPGDLRSAAIGPRAWPSICAQLWIKTPGTKRWNPLDLTGVNEVRFRMIDRHANAVVLDRLANVVGDPLDGRVEYPWDPGDVDVPGDYLGRWRVDFESHHEKPLFVPLREEHDVLVTS